jgi:hypothetical protein
LHPLPLAGGDAKDHRPFPKLRVTYFSAAFSRTAL